MAGDDKVKECKHCMTLISRRASVCPQCRNSVSFFAGLQGFVRTGAWLVTATVSLAFAGLEKIDNLGLSQDLQAAGIKLDKKEIALAATEIQTEVLREAISKFARPQQAAMAMSAPPTYGGATPDNTVDGGAPRAYSFKNSAPAVDSSAQISEIDKAIDELLNATPIDRRKIKDLEREKLQLELGLVP